MFAVSLFLCSILPLLGLGEAIFKTFTIIWPWKSTWHTLSQHYSFPTLPADHYANEDSFIPKIIHLTWRDEKVFEYPESNSFNTWKWMYLRRGWKVDLWTDVRIRALIRLKYSYLWPVYKSYSQNIQRVDLARLVILHSEGGVYVDLDAFPTQNLYFDAFVNQDISLVVAQSSYPSVLTNHFLAAQANRSFLSYALQNAYQYFKYQEALSWFPYWQVMLTTGPLFLTAVFDEYNHKTISRNAKHTLIITDYQLKDYVRHGGGRSWQGPDGRRWNYLIDSGWLWFYLVIGVIFMITSLSYAGVRIFGSSTRRSVLNV